MKITEICYFTSDPKSKPVYSLLMIPSPFPHYKIFLEEPEVMLVVL